ncbi:MAG: lysophospholipid acyltransferase family protein [Polyangiales bacterium]
MSRLLSLLRVVVGFTFLSLLSIVGIALALLLLPARVLRIKLGNVLGKIAGAAILTIVGVRTRFRDRARLQGSFPAIYVMNHASTLDVFLSIWMCPIGGCGVIKREITRVPFFGQIYQLSGHPLIDRNDRGQAVAALDDVATLMKRHRLGLWILPEGTRSRDGRLRPFKTGFVHLALATRLPVVPVVVRGAQNAWRSGTLHVQPATVEIDVLEPISTESWTAATAREHADDVHARFLEHLGDDQRPLPVAS